MVDCTGGPTATILEQKRAALWQQWLGTDQVPILTPFPVIANLPGLGDRLVVMLDLDRLRYEEVQWLAQGIAERFGLDPSDVREEMATFGTPILLEGVMVTSGDGRFSIENTDPPEQRRAEYEQSPNE